MTDLDVKLCKRGHRRTNGRCRECQKMYNSTRAWITDASVIAGMLDADGIQRFWSYTERCNETGCLLWTGAIGRGGYGFACLFLGHKKRSNVLVHRLAYVLAAGPIPDGLQIDHLCRVRRCVEPSHLEPVTARENTMRSPIAPAAVNAAKTHCVSGHEFDLINTYWEADGHRACRACARAKSKRYRQRKALKGNQ